MLALIAEVVNGASNVRFGPELYCSKRRHDADVFGGFEHRVHQMAADLRLAAQLDVPHSSCRVTDGDARDLRSALRSGSAEVFSAVICSPPYPTEHDYTRNARLELAFLECVSDVYMLRVIKRDMIRSHTKGIYSDDTDRRSVSRYRQIESLARRIDRGVRDKSHGFGKLYSTVLREYFGGMKRHFLSVRGVLRPGAKAAYVVGEQASYADVPIPTAEILASVARASGFKVEGIEEWRTRRSSKTNRIIGEHILLLSVPDRKRRPRA